MLQQEIDEVKAHLKDPSLPFGVDLAIPQIGGNARKTNHDYTHGKLPELTEIIVKERATLFVCAVGVPPKWMVDKLHEGGVLVMNMVGHPRHVEKALEAGVDMICAQGTEGGGHTGEVATTVLLPVCVDMCKGRKSPLTGEQVMVVAGGGMFDGRSLAAALSLGASGVWVGTRFIACTESGAPKRHQKLVLQAGVTDTTKTLIYSGRPVRTYLTDYVKDWEARPDEIRELCEKGVVPIEHEMKELERTGKDMDFAKVFPMLMGQCSGAITESKPAAEIMEEMVWQAICTLQENYFNIKSAKSPLSKL